MHFKIMEIMELWNLLELVQQFRLKRIVSSMFKVVFKQLCSKEQIAPLGLAQTEASVHIVGPRYYVIGYNGHSL